MLKTHWQTPNRGKGATSSPIYIMAGPRQEVPGSVSRQKLHWPPFNFEHWQMFKYMYTVYLSNRYNSEKKK